MKLADLRALAKRGVAPLLLAALAWVFAAGLGSAITLSPIAWSYSGAHGWSEFFQKLLTDLGVGVLIAWMVKEFVERGYEERAREQRAAVAETSLKAAARAVFGSLYADDTVEEVTKSIFTSTLLRPSWNITYTFRRHAASSSLILLTSLVEFRVQNTGALQADYDVKIGFPNLMARYPTDPMRSPPRLLSASFGPEGNVKRLADEMVARLNQSIKIDDLAPVLTLASTRLQPGATYVSRHEVELLKLSHDVEVMRMFVPTKNPVIEVENLVGDRFDISIKATHRADFADPEILNADGSKVRYRGDGLFLQNNGWVLFWNDLELNPSQAGGL